jgi:hypothetical protein
LDAYRAHGRIHEHDDAGTAMVDSTRRHELHCTDPFGCMC